MCVTCLLLLLSYGQFDDGGGVYVETLLCHDDINTHSVLAVTGMISLPYFRATGYHCFAGSISVEL